MTEAEKHKTIIYIQLIWWNMVHFGSFRLLSLLITIIIIIITLRLIIGIIMYDDQ